MKISKYLASLLLALFCLMPLNGRAAHGENTDEKPNVQNLVMEHTADAHEWHITTINGKPFSIPLPVIVYSSTGWHVFMSSAFEEAPDGCHEGLTMKEGKIYEICADGAEERVIDISITKNVVQLWIVVGLLLFIFLYCANWYKHKTVQDGAPKGFVGIIEMTVMFVYTDVICAVIPEHRRPFFTPYLLTAFFFIFLSNLIGLIPIFPGGANLTGNITITLFLAAFTMIMVNVFGNKHYWKDIFWPDVPWWLKAPIPLLPVIEFFGILTKPFALMVRLFANIFGGHAVAISLTCVIFITCQMGVVLGSTISPVSVFLMVFMDFLELLVAFIQAFVFTILSAIFIGLAHQEEEKEHENEEKAIATKS